MAGQGVPLRCPTPGCRKILAEAGAVTVGWIRITCRHCKQTVTLRPERPAGTDQPIAA